MQMGILDSVQQMNFYVWIMSFRQGINKFSVEFWTFIWIFFSDIKIGSERSALTQRDNINTLKVPQIAKLGCGYKR